MKTVACRYVIVFLAGIGLAQAECPREQIKDAGVTEAMLMLITHVMSNSLTAPCQSLTTVLNKLASRGKPGGRRLEEDKPLDLQEAQANLQNALNDPGVRARIERMHRDEKDEKARLVYEAAILDEEGHYNARDLKIQQLQQKFE